MSALRAYSVFFDSRMAPPPRPYPTYPIMLRVTVARGSGLPRSPFLLHLDAVRGFLPADSRHAVPFGLQGGDHVPERLLLEQDGQRARRLDLRHRDLDLDERHRADVFRDVDFGRHGLRSRPFPDLVLQR